VCCRTARGRQGATGAIKATIILGLGRINGPRHAVHTDSRRYIHRMSSRAKRSEDPGSIAPAPGGWVPDRRVPRLPG
jgi:hypothetical protein